jgi:hypothetical protein
MPDWLVVLLIGLVMPALWVVGHRLQQGSSKPRDQPYLLAFCA